MPIDQTTSLNIASHLPRMAGVVPDHPAVIVTRTRDRNDRAVYEQLTFAQLEALSNRYAHALTAAGLRRGMRTLVMVRPGFDFIALAFAMFKVGAVPVMIDPGMGVARLLDCVRSVELEAFIGIPLAHVMRVLKRRAFRGVKHVITVGRRYAWGGASLHKLARRASDQFDMEPTEADETAAILFTSGSTGPAKGVVYEHGMFDAQVRMIQERYDMQPGEIDLPAFPLFALFSTAMGMTSVIPDMDPSRPAEVNPERIIEPILDHDVTTTFGSPALWRRVSDFCLEHDIKLPSLKRVLMAGAPVPWSLIARMRQVLEGEADVHTPYGATECLPVASICGERVLADCAERSKTGAGTCVGHRLPDMDVRLIDITDAPLARWTESLAVENGQIGEIVVAGPVATKAYFNLPKATEAAKIYDGDKVWHRMGDVGYRDALGQLWFCGRKAHRVETAQGVMFPIPCEAIFNEHPSIMRSALVGIGDRPRQEPVMVVELEPGTKLEGHEEASLKAELLELAASCEHTRPIRHVLIHEGFPVDIRHNIKIDREILAHWAAEQLR